MTNLFEQLLHSLGTVFHLNLHVDSYNSCSIKIHDHLIIQLQPDIGYEFLWLFAKIGEIPPGAARELVLKNALKENALPDPRPAAFGYIDATSELALFQKYPLPLLTGERLAGAIGSFLELAQKWQKH